MAPCGPVGAKLLATEDSVQPHRTQKQLLISDVLRQEYWNICFFLELKLNNLAQVIVECWDEAETTQEHIDPLQLCSLFDGLRPFPIGV